MIEQEKNLLLRFWLLGGLRIEAQGKAIELPGKKNRQLCAYLLLHPGAPHRREQLADRLWPDAPPDRVRRALSDSLYRLRQVLGSGWIETDEQTIRLVQQPGVWVDLWEFERLAEHNDLPALERAIQLYSGDLLPELADDWVYFKRVHAQEQLVTALLKIAQLNEALDRTELAHAAYLKAARLDPLREDIQRGLMRSLAHLDRLPEALAAFEAFERELDAQLEVAPTLETRRLADQLRSELSLERTAPAHPGQAAFTGRVGERSRLLARLDEARSGRGGLVVLAGEAGIGKTRLLQEIADSAGWRGWQVFSGRAAEFSQPAPYAPLGEALLAALPAPRLEQLAQWMEPAWLGVLASLLPDIKEHLPVGVPGLRDERRAIALALANLLQNLQRIHPHLILLDDVQWAHPALWTLLEELRPALSEQAVLIILSGRDDELQSEPAAWEAIQNWDRVSELRLSLGGMARSELRELLGARVSEPHLDQIITETGGNPLFALELAQAGDLDYLLAHQPDLGDLVLRRLAGVSEYAQYALQAAAVIGATVKYSLWQAVLEQAGFPVTQLPVFAGEIERAGLLMLEQNAYRFPHDTLRTALLQQLPPQVRREWHARTLAVLLATHPRATLEILPHARQSSSPKVLAEYAYQAGEQALEAFAYPSAAGLFREALGALPDETSVERFQTLRGLFLALEQLADRQAQAELLPVLETASAALPDPALRREVTYFRSRYAWQTGELDLAQRTGRTACEQALEAGDQNLLARSLEVVGCAARDQGDYPAALAAFQEMTALYARQGNTLGEANGIQMSGIVAQRIGDYPEAVRLHRQAAQLAAQSRDRLFESRILTNLAIDYWGLGDYGQAVDIFTKALALSREIGDRRSEAACLANLGSLHALLGDYPAAVTSLEQALAIERLTLNVMSQASILGNLATARFDYGGIDQALDLFSQALELNQAAGRRRGRGYTLHGRGNAWLESGHLERAAADLEQAVQIRAELGERSNQAYTLAALAETYARAGDLALASERLAQSLALLADQDDPITRMQAAYAAFVVYEAQGNVTAALQNLLAARQILDDVAGQLPAEAAARYLENNYASRKIQAALDRHTHQVTVRLPRQEAPLGRAVLDSEYVQVRWTLAAPQDGQVGSSSERRQWVLRRLLQEAADQGAAPTDTDLARALGVSRRTILRDMDTLKRTGIPLPTRRRKASGT